MGVTHCADCRHFSPNDHDYPYEGWGDCTRITDDRPPFFRPDRSAPADLLALAWDGEGYSAGLYVAPEFGCVLGEPR